MGRDLWSRSTKYQLKALVLLTDMLTELVCHPHTHLGLYHCKVYISSAVFVCVSCRFYCCMRNTCIHLYVFFSVEIEVHPWFVPHNNYEVLVYMHDAVCVCLLQAAAEASNEQTALRQVTNVYTA